MNSEELQRAVMKVECKADLSAFRESKVDELREVVDKMKRQDFDYLGSNIHQVNVSKGFWNEPEMMDKYVAKLALIHSEVTEVLEALRKGHGPDAVTEEFADILIRLFDLHSTLVEAGEAAPELYGVMMDKIEKNKQRPPKHSHRWG